MEPVGAGERECAFSGGDRHAGHPPMRACRVGQHGEMDRQANEKMKRCVDEKGVAPADVLGEHVAQGPEHGRGQSAVEGQIRDGAAGT